MPDFSRNSPLDDNLSFENLCPLHKDNHTEGLFEDVLTPCNNLGCRFYSSKNVNSSRKKGKENKLITHTNIRKRLRLTPPDDQQEKENSDCVVTAETKFTCSIPVKSFYNKQNKSLCCSPSPVQNEMGSPLPSLFTVDELNESESHTSRDRQPIWTRSRPYIFSDPTITYPPYDIGFV